MTQRVASGDMIATRIQATCKHAIKLQMHTFDEVGIESPLAAVLPCQMLTHIKILALLSAGDNHHRRGLKCLLLSNLFVLCTAKSEQHWI